MSSHRPLLAGYRRGSIPGLYPDVPGSFGQRPTTTYSPPSDQPMDLDELASPHHTRSHSPPPRPGPKDLSVQAAPMYPTISESESMDMLPIATDQAKAGAPAVTESPADTVTPAARELSEQFAWVLTTRKHDLLDQEHGVLMTYASMCEDRVAELEADATTDPDVARELATIKAEARTWLLFRTILLRRQNAGFVETEPELEDVPYFSDKVAAANALKDDDDLVELMLVQSWLEESFQRVLQTANLPLYPATRITADPLSPSSPDDPNSEAFFKVVFDLVQAGLVDKAKAYAERCQRTWVALALAGCKLHDVDGGEDWNAIDAVEGNLNRSLFKSMCASMAAQSGIGRFERAVFSLLSGHLEGVLAVCDTYESALHAIVTCSAEARTAKYVGSDGTNDFFHVATAPAHVAQSTMPPVDLSKLTLHDIVASIQEGKLARKLDIKPAVTAQFGTFYPQVHARLLRDRSRGLVDLLEWFHKRHVLGVLDLSQRRFITHMVLAVRQLDLVRQPLTSALSGNAVEVDVVMRDLVHGYILALRNAAAGLLPAIPVYARAVPAPHRPALLADALVAGHVQEWGDVFKRMDKMPGGFDALEVAVQVVRRVADSLKHAESSESALVVNVNSDACVKLIHGAQLVVAYGVAMYGDQTDEMLQRVVPVVTLVVRILLSAAEWEMADEVAASVPMMNLSPSMRYMSGTWQLWELVDYQAFLRVVQSPFALGNDTDSDSEPSPNPDASSSFPTGLDLWLSDVLSLLESNWLQFDALTPAADAGRQRRDADESLAMAQCTTLYRTYARMLVTRVAANLAPVCGAFPTLVHRLLAVVSRHRKALFSTSPASQHDAGADLISNLATCMRAVAATTLREEAAWGKAAKARFTVDPRIGGGGARDRARGGLPRPDIVA